tara:strand:+ start:199 stop:348 length:150 start_codon:yes stop_codon:yes gene_type:complete
VTETGFPLKPLFPLNSFTGSESLVDEKIQTVLFDVTSISVLPGSISVST